MKSLPLLVSMMVWLAGLSVAQDLEREPVEKMERLETVDGRTYDAVRVMKVTASELRFIHKEGAASVRLADLSPEMQRKFEFDAAAGAKEDAKAAEIRAAQVAAAHAEEAKEMGEKDERAAKRATALKYLKDNKYGGRTYWESTSNWRARMNVQARSKLEGAGFSKEEIEKIIHEMREAGKREPAPADRDPAFRPRANTEALRFSPSGIPRDKGITSQPLR